MTKTVNNAKLAVLLFTVFEIAGCTTATIQPTPPTQVITVAPEASVAIVQVAPFDWTPQNNQILTHPRSYSYQPITGTLASDQCASEKSDAEQYGSYILGELQKNRLKDTESIDNASLAVISVLHRADAQFDAFIRGNPSTTLACDDLYTTETEGIERIASYNLHE